MHGGLKDLTGRVFTRLTVLGLAPQRSGKRAKPMWNCRCECGTETVVIGDNLRSGCSKSCGCLDLERTKQRFTKHGASSGRSVEYQTWKRMKDRCLNPNNPKYARYGGRGITVCAEWIDDFPRFLADMGPRPAGHSIERIDNDGHYERGNCKWAKPREQSRNTGRTRRVTIDGETLCITDWAVRYGLRPVDVIGRLHKGWTVERALRTPVQSR